MRHGTEGEAANAGRPVRGGRLRTWAFRLAAAILIPALFLLLLTLGLRLGGYGYPTGFFVASERPGEWVTNPSYGWRFFPPAIARSPVPTTLPAGKPAGTYRIFVLGGSAAQGVPDPSQSFGRLLELMLRRRYPRMQFEVVNAAMTAINSHVARLIARDCARLEPDLFVVYLGNNEVVGPFGPGTVLTGVSSSRTLIRARLWTRSTRIGQWLTALGGGKSADADRLRVWRGMEMFLEQRVAADDPCLERVYENFRANLTDIGEAGHRAGADVILCTVAVNLRDCPPFASALGENLTPGERPRWRALYEEGVALAGQGKPAEALDRLRDAFRLDDRSALLHFRLARLLQDAGHFDEAAHHYARARDLDLLRFRADSRLNQVVREVADTHRGRSIHLVDAAEALAGDPLTPDGLTGAEMMHEHVHLTFEGNYALARAVFDQVTTLIEVPGEGAVSEAAPPLSREQAAGALPRTIWDDYRGLHTIHAMVGRPPFTNQLEHTSRLEALDRRLASLEADLTAEALEDAVRRYTAALADRPGDTARRENLARLLHRRGHYTGAAGEWHRIIERIPNHGEAYLQRALALAMAGHHDEAAASFARGLHLVPHQARLAHNDMGNALEAVGQLDEAIDHFRQALQHDPDFAEAHYNLAGVLKSRDRIDEAMDHYRQAVLLKPGFAVAHYDLACVLQAEGRTDPAIEHYRKALEIDPDEADTHYNLANALLSRRELDLAIDQYRQAILLRPELVQARVNLGGALALQGRLDEAIVQFREVLLLDPDSMSGLENLSQALSMKDRAGEALALLRQWMQQEPGAARPRERAAWILATHRDPGVRRRDEAIRLAEQAASLTRGQDPAVLDTLAAAYASAGRFGEAVTTAHRALDLAAASEHRRTEGIRRRLALYERREPFRDDGSGAGP